MQIRPATSAPVYTSSRKASQVATPPPQPDFPKGLAIEDVAAQLQSQWAERMGGQEKSVVGLVCERGWRPTEQHDDVLNIADAIMDAGGLPRLIFLGHGDPQAQMQGVQALALPGGRDIDPTKYGATLGPNMDPNEPDPAFDDFEIALIRQAYDTGLPMLGHCRGFQLMNVAGGGTMKQHVPVDHQAPPGWGSKYATPIDHRPEASRHDFAARVDPVQFLFVEDGARLHDLVGSLDSVNSIHHQCLDQVSPLLEPVAFALDGLVEGVERQGMPWQAGYQFHPEALRYTDCRYQGIYDNLVHDGARFGRGELQQVKGSTKN